MSLIAETPVTTITSVADYRRTNERIGQFVTTLAKIMSVLKFFYSIICERLNATQAAIRKPEMYTAAR